MSKRQRDRLKQLRKTALINGITIAGSSDRSIVLVVRREDGAFVYENYSMSPATFEEIELYISQLQFRDSLRGNRRYFTQQSRKMGVSTLQEKLRQRLIDKGIEPTLLTQYGTEFKSEVYNEGDQSPHAST